MYCIPQYTLLTWNEYYDCWDDEEGDDQLYKKEAVNAWCEIPKYDLEDK